MALVVSIVLAAGKGFRLGGPKALLLWPRARGTKPRPLAIAHAEARLSAESQRVIVVARRQVIRALIPFVCPGLDLVASDAPDELGPAGSIATAAPRIDADDRVLVCPVDTLPARRAVTDKLLSALGTSGAPPLAARPRYGERFGHPVAMQAATESGQYEVHAAQRLLGVVDRLAGDPHGGSRIAEHRAYPDPEGLKTVISGAQAG